MYEKSWICKGLAQLSGAQLTSPMSSNNDIPQVSGLTKTQGGGELTQKQ